jgi:thiol-disulfide isomerase/thioredoxin
MDHASAVMATIEENFSLMKSPQLIKEAKPVIEGFNKRKALIGQPLDFAGQKLLLTGEEFDPSTIAGKITLVDFWATWCGPCRAEFPNLRELYKKYQEKGFEIVGVNLDDTDAEVLGFPEKESLPWIHLRSLDKSLEGFANPLSQKLSVTAIPFMLLLDREGKVVQIHARGKRLEELLATYFEQ